MLHSITHQKQSFHDRSAWKSESESNVSSISCEVERNAEGCEQSRSEQSRSELESPLVLRSNAASRSDTKSCFE